MSEDKRITRKQADEDPEARKDLEKYYTLPSTSTSIPQTKPYEKLYPALEPRSLSSRDTSSGLLSDSSGDSGNQTVKQDETLEFQLPSGFDLTPSNSDVKKEINSINEVDLDTFQLVKDKDKAKNSSTSSNSSNEDRKMATKQMINLKDALRVIPEVNGTNIPLSQFSEGCDIAKEMIEAEDEKTFVRLLRSNYRRSVPSHY